MIAPKGGPTSSIPKNKIQILSEKMKNSVVKSFTKPVKDEVLELRENLLNEENARELIYIAYT